MRALQKCVFRVDYKIDTIDRDFGTVSVERDGTHVDLGLAVVKAGWAKVRLDRSRVQLSMHPTGQIDIRIVPGGIACHCSGNMS